MRCHSEPGSIVRSSGCSALDTRASRGSAGPLHDTDRSAQGAGCSRCPVPCRCPRRFGNVTPNDAPRAIIQTPGLPLRGPSRPGAVDQRRQSEARLVLGRQPAQGWARPLREEARAQRRGPRSCVGLTLGPTCWSSHALSGAAARQAYATRGPPRPGSRRRLKPGDGLVILRPGGVRLPPYSRIAVWTSPSGVWLRCGAIR
jgi:hypothetical protein